MALPQNSCADFSFQVLANSWGRFLPALGLLSILLAPTPLFLPALSDHSSFVSKETQEIVAPTILLVASLLSLVKIGTFSGNWTFGLALLALLREFHFSGTSGILSAALGAWLLWGYTRRVDLLILWKDPVTRGCFIGMFGLYFISQLLDRGVWNQMVHSQFWAAPLEETLESAGHLALLGACLRILFLPAAIRVTPANQELIEQHHEIFPSKAA